MATSSEVQKARNDSMRKEWEEERDSLKKNAEHVQSRLEQQTSQNKLLHDQLQTLNEQVSFSKNFWKKLKSNLPQFRSGLCESFLVSYCWGSSLDNPDLTFASKMSFGTQILRSRILRREIFISNLVISCWLREEVTRIYSPRLVVFLKIENTIIKMKHYCTRICTVVLSLKKLRYKSFHNS